MNNTFTHQLMTWHSTHNNRKMPWKNEKDAYKIWLSEIILQQTRVEQGLKYYENFVRHFPTIQHLATATEAKLFKMWEGLGYYNRCKNLHYTAKYIVENYNGIFPKDYATILALKGIGTYTAAAISSFAYNQPYAVVDGNVYRVISRYFGNATPIDSTEGRHYFATKAQELLDKKQPGAYNQAIMDFGATICKPKLALCASCPLSNKCIAYQTNTIDELPVKAKKIAIKQRSFIYFLLLHNNKILVRKRITKDVWQNLYEFVLAEQPSSFKFTKGNITKLAKQVLPSINTVQYISTAYTQKLSHQTITTVFVKQLLATPINLQGYEWRSINRLKTIPFAAIINEFLKKEKNELMFGK